MSMALIADLESGAQTQAALVDGRWLPKDLPAAHRKFIQDRKARYSEVFRRVSVSKLIEPRQKAIVLWNAGLLFEMHELLETVWIAANRCLLGAALGNPSSVPAVRFQLKVL